MTNASTSSTAVGVDSPSPARDWVGIDWGTTRRRASRFAGATLVKRIDDAQGLIACAPHFARSLTALMHELGVQPDATPPPIVMAGMVGSASGWQEVPYLDAGTPLRELPQRLQRVVRPDAPPAAWIVPGVCWRDERGAVDVMRGEETQLLGAIELLGDHSDGWYLLPGTHSKWVQLQGGRVHWMRTYLSGELFALLQDKGTLSAIMRAGQASGVTAEERKAFERGVAYSAGAALSHVLFAARAQVVTGALSQEAGAAFVSGALFGAEWHDVAARLGQASLVRLIGDARLCARHAHCAALLGFATEVLDNEAVQDAAWARLRAEGPR